MSNNHLIVGLGGTGGRIMLALRTIIWLEHRHHEPRRWEEQYKKWSEPLAKLGYLYVDSSNKELNESDGLWQSLGESLALDKSEKLLIRDANMEAALQNLKMNPGISGWLGDPEVLAVMIQNSRSSEGANQIRRFGRYLFAQSAKRFEERVMESVRQLTEGGTAEVTFHICCTLGCGTGSGSVIDAITQIRKLYPEGRTHRIFLYVLLTDQHVPENVGFFYPNQYAALAELNALRQGTWRPHDVLAFSEKRLENLRDHFQSCFLISAINEKGEVASKAEQEEMIANYIYQKAVGLRNTTPRCLHQAESFEDYKAHSAILKDRATTFGAFGIKRFRIPEEEIREKLSYTFAYQAVLQALFNNWSDHGFMKAPLNRDLPELVTKPEINEAWCLTDDHLKISKDFVLAGGRNWKSIPDEWKVALEGKKESLLKFKSGTRKDRETWLNEMLAFATASFEKNFRDRGVVNYYSDKREAILDYAREIRKRVEVDLFERWRNGEDALEDTQRILSTLIKQLEKRKGKFDQQSSGSRSVEKQAAENLREIEAKWHRIGWLTDWLTSKPAQILGAYTVALVEKHTAATEAVASGFAKDLLQQVVNQLTEVRGAVIKVQAFFSALADEFEKEVKARIRADETISYQAKDVRLVEPKEIDQTIRALQTDGEMQRSQCASARADVAAALGAEVEARTFSSLAKRVNQEALSRLLFRACDQSAINAHTALFKAPTELRRIVGRNIVEKLYETYGGVTDELKKNITTLVQSAAAYMTFDSQQTQPSILFGRKMPDMPRRAVVVFLPKAKDLEAFREELRSAFVGAYEEAVDVVDADQSANEILLINVCYWFELRFMKPLAALRERYEEFIKSGEKGAIHQIHLENHRVPIRGVPRSAGIGELPRLDLPDEAASAEDAFKDLLLASAIGFLKVEENVRGISTLHYARREGDGMALSDLVDLGTVDLLEASKKVDPRTAERIRADMLKELESSYAHVDQKKVLLDKLDGLRKAKFIERGSKNTDPVFRDFTARIEEVKALVNQV